MRNPTELILVREKDKYTPSDYHARLIVEGVLDTTKVQY
jgi:hypothetical protein